MHRTLQQLRGQELSDLPAEESVADLEAVIDQVIARGHAGMADGHLQDMLLAVVALHEPDVPEDLSSHVATCVRCAAEDEARDTTASGTEVGSGRGRLMNGLAAIAAFMGVCLVCTVPALQTLMFALGVGFAGYLLHLVGVAAAPLVAWLVHRGTRRHGADLAFRLARAGAIVMVGHAVLHTLFEVLSETPVPAWLDMLGMVSFVGTDWIATALLVAGAGLNLVETQRWRRAQAAMLRSAMRGASTPAALRSGS